MSQSLEQFNNGFFTMSGVLAALSIVYPIYLTRKFVCNRFFKNNDKTCNNKCDC